MSDSSKKISYNQVWMRVDLEQDRTVEITVSGVSRTIEHLSKLAWILLKITIDFSSLISSREKFIESF